MLAVLAIGVWGGVTATALTQRKGGTSCRAVEVAWQSGLIVAQVSAFFYTHMPPSSAALGGGLAARVAKNA